MTTVTIGGREFKIGATYAPKQWARKTAKRRLLSIAPNPDYVLYEPLGQFDGTHDRYCKLQQFARWAGDEIKGDGD